MADQVTPALQKSPDEIDRDMAHTREALTEKVAALEAQVVGTVSSAADTLTGTVESVKSLMSQAPSAVSDTVKQVADTVRDSMNDAFDVSARVQKNPWASLGIAALAGCTLGWLTGGRQNPTASAAAVPVPFVPPTQPQAAEREPGVVGELVALMGDSLKDLAKTALASLSASLKEAVQQQVPHLVADRVAGLAEDPAIVRHPSLASTAKAGRMNVI